MTVIMHRGASVRSCNGQGSPDLEEFVEIGLRPLKDNPMYAIMMFKYGTHAPKGTHTSTVAHQRASCWCWLDVIGGL